MIDLAEHLKEYFSDDDELTSLHLFRSGDEWQCNVTHRPTGTWGTKKSKSPITAITKAIEIADLSRKGIERVIAGDHLKKLKPKKLSADDML